ncbi:MAG: hypothetical protein RL488_631 [Actinomycetota bacterium]|jgi:hypothetical protein
MGNSDKTELVQTKVSELVVQAAKVPGVHVNREEYLRSQFDKHCTAEMLDKIVELGPHAAGVPTRIINSVAKSTIRHEVALASALSFAAGVPGGLAMLATIPADLIQFHGGLIRTAQKLSFIHDWPELLQAKGEKLDDETKSVLLIFIGVMYGVTSATAGIAKLAELMAANTARQLSKKALTKTFLYPIVKKVVVAIGGKMTKTIFANSVAKAVPLLGGALSGGITYVSFDKMANRLNNHLAKLQVSKKRAVKREATKKA